MAGHRAPRGPHPGRPATGELSPFDGKPAPLGHRPGDVMWPWVSSATGYDVILDAQVKPFLPDFSAQAPVTVDQMLDTESVDSAGYRYEPPGGP
ncbi:hypothetical protein [Streptomyces sp. NPDC051183]|uniref:hypothetical protein n=1 Tax=unclassified Streptomyces TaxID=2593676 RepID=UPI003413D495